MNNFSEPIENLDAIAIVGMAIRFPGADSVEQFWHNLQQGVESISFFSEADMIAAGLNPELIQNPRYVKARSILENVEQFDANFFGFTPREAAITDPQHRLMLECAWESLENAGYNSETYPGRIGVYAGMGLSSYSLFNLYPNRDLIESVGVFQTLISNDKDFLPTRISYQLNLRGPSVNVQTACSTSLVAVHIACQSLLNGECDMALAGAASIRVPQQSGYLYQEESILSPDGHCRPFDANAQGTVFGNGAGIVVLKRLEDAIAEGDTIRAIIKGSAINNDGHLKVGYTAPSVAGQAEAIAEAMAVANVNPETVSYIQTHGTATALGDPIEIAALTQVFSGHTDKKACCALGSVKSNIGHLDTAAGIAGLIQTVLALEHQAIPPSLHFESPNPQIDFENSPFYVNAKLSEWPAGETPRRAGVSSFGIGGTNAHIVLEEAPVTSKKVQNSRQTQLLVISAKTVSALEQASQNLADYLKTHSDCNLADVAYTLQVGRRGFNYRRMVVAETAEAAAIALSSREPQSVFSGECATVNPPVTFMFPGQGSQYVNMGRGLYDNQPIFREWVDRACELLLPHLGLDLRTLLYPEPHAEAAATEKLAQTQFTQPALFVIEYATAQLWQSWGIQPTGAIGHSIGEYVAACLAGVFSFEDALALVAVRGRLMQQLPGGSMLAVCLSAEEVRTYLEDSLSLATINSPSLCAVSGKTEAIAQLERQLTATGVTCRRLHTSHAFHSPMMEPILDEFRDRVAQVRRNPPQLPFISNLTGTWITPEEAIDPHYWANHLRQPVQFSDGIAEVLTRENSIFLEVGPGRTLSTLTQQQVHPKSPRTILCSLRHPRDGQSDLAFLLATAGRLWLSGVQMDWMAFSSQENPRRIPLPTYPFQRQRYWIDPPQFNRQNSASELPKFPANFETMPEGEPDFKTVQSSSYIAPQNDLEQALAEIWQELLGIEEVGINDNFFELGGHSLLATQLLSRIATTLDVKVPMRRLMETATIAELAVAIEEELIAELEGLSEEEAERLLLQA
ncbi:type I polyketide synthase [Oscillatoria sp. HE19RPO]|uniref:type I polyketide synthase n=1 Tax=Oscillatoria sp. HE19RPO TaxID=2954806 RepID=UPI0020C44C4F|nr:type I polyketide synthase [Oscillatoria sp. HE19RPO]